MNKDNVLTIAAIILGLGGWCFYNLDFKKKRRQNNNLLKTNTNMI